VEIIASDKHSSLSNQFLNFDTKKFYNIYICGFFHLTEKSGVSLDLHFGRGLISLASLDFFLVLMAHCQCHVHPYN